MCNEAIRQILEECQNENLITFKNTIFTYASNRLYFIAFDGIKVLISEPKNQGSYVFNINNNGQLVAQVGNDNTANIELINEEKLFEILTEKMNAIKAELKDKHCEEKINELEDAIKKKDKKSSLEVLSNLASIGSFIAAGISMLPLG